MAFRLGRELDTPRSIEGTYLIPAAWLTCGLVEGNLELDKKKFDNSLQGSVFRWWQDNMNALPLAQQRNADGVSFVVELWLVYKKDGVVDYFYYPASDYREEIYSERIRSGILHICGIGYLKEQTTNVQKTINSSLIQLFPGCGVTMKYTSWF